MTLVLSDETAVVAPQSPPPPAPRRRGRVRSWLPFLPVAIVAIIAIIGPYIIPQSATQVVGFPSTSPNGKFWFGLDSSGLDVFSRTIAATRIDVEIATAVAVIATVVGILLGLAIGMNESRGSVIGFAARGASRFLDLLQAVPIVIISLVVVSFFGISIGTMITALSIILSPVQARLVRTEVLRVRTEAYLAAARPTGMSELQLTIRHVLPNSSVPALQNSSVVFGSTILLTAALGFLGVGLPPPTPEWGSMITRGAGDAATGQLWSAGFPAAALCFTVAAVAVVGARIGARRGRR
jgi:peptide/nickel transport system permease protein